MRGQQNYSSFKEKAADFTLKQAQNRQAKSTCGTS